MFSNTTRFHKIALNTHGIQLDLKANSSDLIPYETIEKIYLSTDKTVKWYRILVFLFVFFCTILVVLCYSYKIIIVYLFILLVFGSFLLYRHWGNWNKYPNIQLIIILNNGSRYHNNISPTNKNDTIKLINQIKKLSNFNVKSLD
jgi:hypothetical protein